MVRRLAQLSVVLIVVAVAARAESREYSRIARLSYVDGHASFQHTGDVDWAAVSVNLALQPGDRIFTGRDGRVEVEFDDGSILRMAENTDIEFLSLKENLIQLRFLLGLSTLVVRSDLDFEVSTPAAAFNTLRQGVYRFDVVENGDSDGIVRKGLLEVSNGKFTQRVESGELLHVTTGDDTTHLLSPYDRRDDWDLWNDRRNAELNAYESSRYLPDYVNVGVRDLDYYGRWVVVDAYGPAWVPSYVSVGWTPYWEGRWAYRPFWGWTWVSYEPWGWLPYHYGRWHHSISFGWCWLPGPSYGFHFWSPGLVRFHHGPDWVSWCPLGPGDYYNVNNYYYHGRHSYQINNLRMGQRRGPEDLANRNIPGAMRTVRTDQFVGDRFGRGSNVLPVNPGGRGRVVTDTLDVRPTSRSYSPIPDGQPVRPEPSRPRPSIVRSEPTVNPGGDLIRRIPGRAGYSSAAEVPSVSSSGDARVGNSAGRLLDSRSSGSGSIRPNPGLGTGSSASIWDRSMRSNPENAGAAGQSNRVAPARGREADPSGRSRESSSAPSRIEPAPAREAMPTRTPAPGGTVDRHLNPAREFPRAAPSRPESTSPSRQMTAPAPSRIEPPARPSREQSPPAPRPRPDQPGASAYSGQRYGRESSDTPAVPDFESRTYLSPGRQVESSVWGNTGNPRSYSIAPAPPRGFFGGGEASRSLGNPGYSHPSSPVPVMGSAPHPGSPGGGAGILRRRGN